MGAAAAPTRFIVQALETARALIANGGDDENAALILSARQLGRSRIQMPGQADLAQQLADIGTDLPLRAARDA